MSLHMVRVRCDLPALYRAVSETNRDADLDYAIHAHLRATFGDQAPQPFRVMEASGRDALVLGYAAHDAATLSANALQLGWSELLSKPMPALAQGAEVGFEVRVCPVRRGRQTGPHPKRNRGPREVDAFVAESWRVGPDVPLNRERVYSGWLRERIEERGIATLGELRMERFRRTRLFRRTQGKERSGRACERPDAIFTGTLHVVDAVGFAHLLEKGLGRHKAFGFGMMLLRARG